MKKKPFIGYFNYTVLLTHISLLSTVFGIYFAIKGIPEAAVYCLMISGICDAFDGKVARTKERSRQEERFGIQLDSLSDIVCFGVLPTVIGYTLGMRHWWYIAVFFFYVMAALTRLAFFNVTEEDRQLETGERRKEYTGLPVTSAAIIIPALYIVGHFFEPYFEIVYAAVMVVTAILFILNFRMRKPSGIFMALLIIFGSALLVMMAKGIHYGA